jgi:hypothetical protein
VQIAVAAVENPAQWMFARYAVLDNWKKGDGEPASLLKVEFNPTSLASGNNVHPVTIAHPKTGVLPAFPSSAPQVIQALNRLGFRFLKEFHEQISNEKHLFERQTDSAIAKGNFQIVRAQFCVYFPTPNVPIFLQLMAILYSHTITEGDSIIQVATHLGIRLRIHTDPGSNLVTGVTLQKLYGDKPVYSLVFYDKRVRVAHMRQGKSLTKSERDTIQKSVRFDATLHKLGILETINAGRRALRDLRKADSHLFDSFAEPFLNGEPEPSAWWLERAVYVLSHRRNGKRLPRGSFATWLVPEMIDDVLHLNTIATYTRSSLQSLVALDDPTVVAWRLMKRSDDHDPIGAIAREAGRSKSTVYERRKAWIKKFAIDIALPFAFYRDQQAFGRLSTMRPEDRTAMNAAIEEKDAKETLRLLTDAATDFDTKRLEVLRTAIIRGPLLMSAKTAASTASDSSATSGSLPTASTGIRPSRQNIPVSSGLRLAFMVAPRPKSALAQSLVQTKTKSAARANSVGEGHSLKRAIPPAVRGIRQATSSDAWPAVRPGTVIGGSKSPRSRCPMT